jgi:hypothetical protein
MNSDESKKLELNTSTCEEEHTNDETNTIDNTSDQVSRVTSRRASFDSHDSVKVQEPEAHKGMIIDAVAFKPMSSVSSPFKPSINPEAASFKPTVVPKIEIEEKEKSTSLTAGLNGLEVLDNGFTPSTPYVHKFRTELCKNFQLYGKCKYGDEVSIFILFLEAVLNLNWFVLTFKIGKCQDDNDRAFDLCPF